MDIASPIIERGARAGIWCDMVMNHPDQMHAIPKELVIWDWNYWDVDGLMEQVRVWGKGKLSSAELTDEIKKQYPEIIGPDNTLRGFYTSDALKKMGFDIFLCSAARSSGDSIFCPLTDLHARNIAGAARKTADIGLLGTCVTDWAIRINSWETHTHLLPIAPMILNDPELDIEKALADIGMSLFGCDPTLFIEAVDMISQVDFPFSRAHSTGIQWNGFKDSLPPPQGYIKKLLTEWNADGRLEKEKESIDSTIDQISSGIEKLNSFIDHAQKGTELLQFWSRAAQFQLNQARIAREILNNNKTEQNIQTLHTLKKEYEKFLQFDQTPESAAKNAELVYDCLIEYMEIADIITY
jgi:hypothetical protein